MIELWMEWDTIKPVVWETVLRISLVSLFVGMALAAISGLLWKWNRNHGHANGSWG